MLWVFDLDGVIWLAGQAIPGSPEAVNRLRDEGHRVAFVTNNSTPTVAEYVERLAHAGITIEPGELASSSQAAATLLEAGQRVACVGGEGVKEALAARDVELVAANRGPDAVVVGRSLKLDFGELAAAATAIRNGARFIATNTDATFPTPHGPEPGAGALIAYLQVGSGVAPEVAGKPEGPMADLVRDRYGQPDVVVGDRAETDGAFAARIGAPFALVLTGVTQRGDLPVSPAPALVADDLAHAVKALLDRREG
jgi:HAD superfamily hydrolase (TIGR01450 family)